MSELKVINAYLPTFDADHNDMLLVSHTKENYVPAKQIECYLKSEADKVIADLEESHKKEVEQLLMEIVELKADYKEVRGRLQTANLIKDEQLAAIRHHKYKRCLDKAKIAQDDWHLHNSFYAMGHQEFEKRKCKFYEKWRKRWLELAEKFKEVIK